VFQNTFAQLIGRVFSIGFSAVSSVLLARFLGKERLGEYGALYAYLSLYGFFATFCLEQILAREVSQHPEKSAELFRTGTLTALGFAVAGTLIAPAIAPLFGYTGTLRWLIGVAAIDALILPPICFSGIIFQTEMRLWYSVAVGLLRQALWVAAVVLLVLRNAAFYEVIIARTLVGIVSTMIVLWNVKRVGLVQGTAKFIPQEARKMLLAGFPLVLTTLASGIYHRIDQVMLHKMSGDRVLGPYVIAVQLTELFSMLPIALMTSLFPALAQSANDEEKFTRYLGESYRFLLVIVFAACALVSPVAAPVIELFYGKEYLPTAGLLIVLIWSEVPIFFAAALGSALIAKNLQRHTPLPALLCAGINILLNLWAIPHYGALGASWATVVSYSLGIFYLLFISTTRPLVTQGLAIALWPFLLSLGIALGLTRFQAAFWWKLLLASCLYLAGGWVSGMIKKSDIERLQAMFRQGIA
jgi:PST family polysaccharide transporter